jgi:hypothetical protein
MSKFWAKVENNIVTNTIYGENPLDDGEYIEFNHEGTIRANPAVIGSPYDRENDVFILPKPFDSWTLNESFKWESPVGDQPTDGVYRWDESSTNWIKIVPLSTPDH